MDGCGRVARWMITVEYDVSESEVGRDPGDPEERQCLQGTLPVHTSLKVKRRGGERERERVLKSKLNN